MNLSFVHVDGQGEGEVRCAAIVTVAETVLGCGCFREVQRFGLFLILHAPGHLGVAGTFVSATGYVFRKKSVQIHSVQLLFVVFELQSPTIEHELTHCRVSQEGEVESDGMGAGQAELMDSTGVGFANKASPQTQR